MEYTATLPFHGDIDRALGLAETALTALGFNLKERTDRVVDMTGVRMNNTRQSPLVGASHIRVVSESDQLTVEADLSGANFMAKFVTFFPGLLCAGMCIVMSVIFWSTMGPGP